MTPDLLEHQPRERPVPCQLCGVDRHGRPRTMTWNHNAICDKHRKES